MKFGLPASSFMPSLATTTPVPVAMELPMPGAAGLPSEARMSVSASGSWSGRAGPAGLNGQVWAPVRRGTATFLTSRCGAGAAGAIATFGSGMIRATAGSRRSRPTSAADTVAATELGAASWSSPVPWLARMLDTMPAWSARAAARSRPPVAPGLRPVCWSRRTTITAPPLAAPASAGAIGAGTAAADAKPGRQ